MTRLLLLLLALGLTLPLSACTTAGDDDDSAGDDDDATDDPTPDVEGNYLDSWGTFHVVTEASWTTGVYPDASVYDITSWDTDADQLVARNADTNAWNPGLYSRFDWWTSDAGDLYYCQAAYDAASEADAQAAATPDSADLDTGCGGFGWTMLDRHESGPQAFVGDFIDSWGTHHNVRQGVWKTAAGSAFSSYELTRYNNVGGYLIGQNGADNEWSPDLWSRFDLHNDGSDWWYCQTAFAADSEQAAHDTPAADSSDLGGEGCGGFSWTSLGADQGLLSIVGNYTDEWGTDHDIKHGTWITSPGEGQSEYSITQYNNANGRAIARNSDDNVFDPGLWSRFDWTTDNDGVLWYCQTAYNAADADAALATAPADSTDPVSGGCNGFSWTNLTP